MSKEQTNPNRRRVVTVVSEAKSTALEYVNRLEINVPTMSYEVLIQKACNHYNDWEERSIKKYRYINDNFPATPDSDLAFLERITVNYLRHQLTSYEKNLSDTFGEKGRYNAVMKIRKKVYKAIATTYPQLAKECQQQLKRKAKF